MVWWCCCRAYGYLGGGGPGPGRQKAASSSWLPGANHLQEMGLGRNFVAIGRRHAVPPRLTFPPSSLDGRSAATVVWWAAACRTPPANGMTRVGHVCCSSTHAHTLSPASCLGLVQSWCGGLRVPCFGIGLDGGRWRRRRGEDGRPLAPFPRTRTVTFCCAQRWGESGSGAERRAGRWWPFPWCCGGGWWWWLVEGGLGLKDEAALQFRSGHGTWKRNVSSRHPANRRRCNPPLVSPESRGSLVLIGFWVFFFGVDVCFLSDASIARAESGHWGRRKRAEWSVHDGLFPRHLTLLCPSFHLLLPNCGAKQVVKVLFSKPHISFCPPLSRASRCIVWSASAYDPPSTPTFAHLGHLSSLRGLRQSPASLPRRTEAKSSWSTVRSPNHPAPPIGDGQAKVPGASAGP